MLRINIVSSTNETRQMVELVIKPESSVTVPRSMKSIRNGKQTVSS